KANFDIWEDSASPGWTKRLRDWLSHHSIIYQIVFHGPLQGLINGEAQIKNVWKNNSSATSLVIPEKNISEAFLPKGMLSRLDQENASIREGMLITFKLLKEMNDTCRENHIEFVVVVIPTKEMVFSDFLQHKPELPLSDVLDSLIANQQVAREKLFKFLGDS